MANDIIIPYGKDAAIYYDTADGAAPTYTAAKQFFGVKDVTVTCEKDESDASRRRFPGWHDQRVGMKNLRVAFDTAAVTVDDVASRNELAVIDILRALWLTDLYDSRIGIALYVRASETAIADAAGGMSADFAMTKFDRNEPLNDLQSYSCEFILTLIHGRTPEWIESLPA